MGGPSRRRGLEAADLSALKTTVRAADDAYDAALSAAQMAAASEAPQAFGRPAMVQPEPAPHGGHGARLLHAAIHRCVAAVEHKKASARQQSYVRELVAASRAAAAVEASAAQHSHASLMAQLARAGDGTGGQFHGA